MLLAAVGLGLLILLSPLLGILVMLTALGSELRLGGAERHACRGELLLQVATVVAHGIETALKVGPGPGLGLGLLARYQQVGLHRLLLALQQQVGQQAAYHNSDDEIDDFHNLEFILCWADTPFFLGEGEQQYLTLRRLNDLTTALPWSCTKPHGSNPGNRPDKIKQNILYSKCCL